MVNNSDFTKNYLVQIISPTEQHELHEWMDARKKLLEITRELELDALHMGVESLKSNLAENEPEVLQEIKRVYGCEEFILLASVRIIKKSYEDGFKYEDVSESIREMWWELISFFDYSPNLHVSAYILTSFSNCASLFEETLNVVAERLSA